MSDALFSKHSHFGASQKEGQVCLCVGCGRQDLATECISEYPFKWVPKRWLYAPELNALWCANCRLRDMDRGMQYAKTHVVFRDADGQLSIWTAKELAEKFELSPEVIASIRHSADPKAHIKAMTNMAARVDALEEQFEQTKASIEKASSIEALAQQLVEHAPAVLESMKMAHERPAMSNAPNIEPFFDYFFSWETSDHRVRTFAFQGVPFLEHVYHDTSLREDLEWVFDRFLTWVAAPQRYAERRQLRLLLNNLAIEGEAHAAEDLKVLLHIAQRLQNAAEAQPERIANFFEIRFSEEKRRWVVALVTPGLYDCEFTTITPPDFAYWDAQEPIAKQHAMWIHLEHAARNDDEMRKAVCEHLKRWDVPDHASLHLPAFSSGLGAAIIDAVVRDAATVPELELTWTKWTEGSTQIQATVAPSSFPWETVTRTTDADTEAIAYLHAFFEYTLEDGKRIFTFEGERFYSDDAFGPAHAVIPSVFEEFAVWVSEPHRHEARAHLREVLVKGIAIPPAFSITQDVLSAAANQNRVANLFTVIREGIHMVVLLEATPDLPAYRVGTMYTEDWDALDTESRERTLWCLLDRDISRKQFRRPHEHEAICEQLTAWDVPIEARALPIFTTVLCTAVQAALKGHDVAEAWTQFNEAVAEGMSQVHLEARNGIAKVRLPNGTVVKIREVAPGMAWQDPDDLDIDQRATDALRRGTEKETTMPEPKTPMKQQLDAIKTAGLLGAKLAITDQAGELFLDIAKELGDDVPAIKLMLQSEDGREVIKLLMALLVQTMSLHTNFVPKAEMMQEVAGIQLTASSFKLLSGKLALIRKFIPKLTELGEQMEGLGVKARVETEEDVELQRLAEEEIEVELADLKEKAAKE